MSDSDELGKALSRARRALNNCCGPIILKYEPGVTYAVCTECKRKVAVPDWGPDEVVKLWN